MVSVVDKPYITKPAEPKSTLKVYATGENKLVCIADANPSPTFTWKKDGTNIKVTKSSFISTLTLSSVSKYSTGIEYVMYAQLTTSLDLPKQL